MRTEAMRERAGITAINEPVVLSKSLINDFLTCEAEAGKSKQTILVYKRGVCDLYDYLPDDKLMTKERLKEWEDSLTDYGYADSTIAAKMTGVNELLSMVGREDLRTTHNINYMLIKKAPDITIEEYDKLLNEALKEKTKKTYLMIKLFAMTGIKPSEIGLVTVESAITGTLTLPNGEVRGIPGGLRYELFEYAKSKKISSGPMFITKNGNPIDRANLTNALREVAHKAGLDMAKGSPRALIRLYKKTQQEVKTELNVAYMNGMEKRLCGNMVI